MKASPPLRAIRWWLHLPLPGRDIYWRGDFDRTALQAVCDAVGRLRRTSVTDETGGL